MALPRAATAATGPRDRCHVLPRDRNNNKDRAPIAGRRRIIEKGTTLPRAGARACNQAAMADR